MMSIEEKINALKQLIDKLTNSDLRLNDQINEYSNALTLSEDIDNELSQMKITVETLNSSHEPI